MKIEKEINEELYWSGEESSKPNHANGRCGGRKYIVCFSCGQDRHIVQECPNRGDRLQRPQVEAGQNVMALEQPEDRPAAPYAQLDA